MKHHKTKLKLWQMRGGVIACFTAIALSACSSMVPDFVALDGPSTSELTGFVAADEPKAALAGSDVLQAGGNAVDAAVAVGFSLAVTLPSRAGLGSGGACLVYDEDAGRSETLVFYPSAPTLNGQPPRFQTGIPALARGLFALHARYGELQWPAVVVPAETLARFGQRISRSLAKDLAETSGSLVSHRAALDRFMDDRRQMLKEGDFLRQLDLAAVLGRIRGNQAGVLYSGNLATDLAVNATSIGGGLTPNDLQSFVPKWRTSEQSGDGKTMTYSLPGASATPSERPERTVFATADAFGNAVACELTMGQPFGAGLLVPDFGFLLARPDDGSANLPLAISVNTATGSLLAVEAGSQNQAEESGYEGNAIRCPGGGLKANPRSCEVNATWSGSSFGLVAGAAK